MKNALSRLLVFRKRWLAIAPILAFAAANVYLGVSGSSLPGEPRTPTPFEVTSDLDGVDFEEERRLAAQRLESRPVVVQFGDEVAEPVRAKLEVHLEAVSTEPVEVVDSAVAVEEIDADVLAIGIGDTPVTRALIEPEEAQELGEEGYVLRSGEVGEASLIAVRGSGTARSGAADVGALYGAYALLEELGFGFLHPLEPTVPLALPGQAPSVDRATAPRWPVRGLHLHTMHPTEFSDLLQGWGPKGPEDEEGWEAMLDEWDQLLEWLLANGQASVQWVWLAADSWMDFANSQERIDRITQVVERAHEFGLEVGLSVPIRLQQQNSARLIRSTGSMEDEVRQIEEGVSHVMQAGFDYLTTKPGTTEFTQVEDERMLAWMNAMAEYSHEEYGATTYMKIHTSTGQYADDFANPDTGEPINFNFLPKFADERLGVLPHTVQHYSLSDPAPTYGNEDFGHIREFLQWTAGSRPTVWYPETAYWVSFDVDVPLFLPVYASRRIHDLRLLAGDEEAGKLGRGEHEGSMMDGQFIFSSGWEWGYWIQEVVTARGAWDPHVELATDEEALRELLEPVERVFEDAGEPLVDWLVEYIDVQQKLLIEGRFDGAEPRKVARRNGQGYLQGWETWDDISHAVADRLGQEKGRMQPDRYSPVQLRSRSFERDTYRSEIQPLLVAMEERFAELRRELDELRDDVPANALVLYEEIRDAAEITALRALQVRALYDYVDADERGLYGEARDGHLHTAQGALDRALHVSAHREKHYRVDTERIAGWRDNPTVYPFTYLWTSRSLFYWQRDEAQAITGSRNPCLFNIIDPIDVVEGDGRISRFVDRVGGAMSWLPVTSGISECMSAPSEEPDFLLVEWRQLAEEWAVSARK